MNIRLYFRRLLERGFVDFFPYTAMYTSNCRDDCLLYSEIPLVRELERLAIENGYQMRLEIYPHHKVCDVVIENDNNDCFFKSNIVVSYSLLNKKIIGCDISDSNEFPSFTEFIRELVARYIEPIRGEIEKW